MDKNQNYNLNFKILDDESTSSIVGGFLGPNKYSEKEYLKADIKVCTHTWKKDEFFISKTIKKVSKSDSNNIVKLKQLNAENISLGKNLKSYINQKIKLGDYYDDAFN